MRNLIVAGFVFFFIVIGRLQNSCAAPQNEIDGSEIIIVRGTRYRGSPFFWVSRPINDDGEDTVGGFGGQSDGNNNERYKVSYAVIGAGWG